MICRMREGMVIPVTHFRFMPAVTMVSWLKKWFLYARLKPESKPRVAGDLVKYTMVGFPVCEARQGLPSLSLIAN